MAALLAPSVFTQAPPRELRSVWKHLRETYDANGDGIVSAKEYPRGTDKFARFDRDGDGVLTAADFEDRAPRARGPRSSPRAREERAERVALPKAGDLAPDFELPLASDPKQALRLSSLRGAKPVALIFGSYT